MASLAVPAGIEDMIDREWRRLAATGTWLTGAERVAVAASARGEKAPSDSHRTGRPGNPRSAG